MIRCCAPRSRILCKPQARRITSYARRSSIAKLLDTAPDEHRIVEATGWIRTIRKQKRVAFASIQDGSTINAAQVVLSPEQAASLVNYEPRECALC